MAWDILRNEFEDLYRVMRAREDKIVSLGSYPSSGRGSAPLKKQVERLMNLPASPFTKQNCKSHMWLCTHYINDNKTLLKTIGEQWRKIGGQFVFSTMFFNPSLAQVTEVGI